MFVAVRALALRALALGTSLALLSAAPVQAEQVPAANAVRISLPTIASAPSLIVLPGRGKELVGGLGAMLIMSAVFRRRRGLQEVVA